MRKRQQKKQTGTGPQWNRRKTWLAIAGILLLVAVAFSSSIDNDFVNWDDPGYVINNYPIREISVASLKQIFTTQVEGNYHPLTVLSFALEYAFAGLNPTSYHITNLLLHLANTAAVFWFILLLTGKPQVAVITGLLFGIHPMHVESVAWISERKDVLHALFYFAALIMYLKAIDFPNRKRRYMILTFMFFVLSLLAKGQAVTLPVVLLLCDYYRQRKWSRSLLLEKLPFFLTAILFGIVAVIAQQAKGAIQDLALFSFLERILIACHSLLTYLYRAFIPVQLSAFYPYPLRVDGRLPMVYFIAPLVVAALVFLVVRSARSNRVIPFGTVFFIVTIALVLQLYPVGSAVMADRYTYLPYIGLFMIIGEGYVRLTSMKLPPFSSARTLMPGIMGIFVIWLGYLTYERCDVWKDNITLWSDVIQKYQIIPAAYTNRAVSYSSTNQFELAFADLNKALELMPTHVEANINRGNLYFHQGNNERAIVDYNRALEANPSSHTAYNSRGAARYNLGLFREALSDFNKALELSPDYPEAYLNRANALSVLGNFDAAVRDYDVYLRYDPAHANAYYWRGLANVGLGRTGEAIRDFTESIRLSPSFAVAYFDRAKALATQGRPAEALADARKAASLGLTVEQSFIDDLVKRTPAQ